MSEIGYLSYSSINLFLTCSEAWRRKYIAKEPQPTTPALLFGSAFHNTIENYISARFEEPGEFNLQQLWYLHWGAAVEREPDCEWGADSPEQHYNEGVRLLANPELTQLLNRLTPLRDDKGLWMEREVYVNVPGVPVPIKGYIDLVTADGIPGDFKTSKFAWTADKAQSQLQALVYLAALNQLGKPSPGMRFRHFVITKTKQPKIQVIESQHTYDALFWMFQLVQKVWKAIENESFVPNPDAWLCSPKFCQAWNQCRGRGL